MGFDAGVASLQSKVDEHERGEVFGEGSIGYEDGLACAQVCLRSGLPCPLLKPWCNSLSGVEQEVCDEYYKYTCGRVSGG